MLPRKLDEGIADYNTVLAINPKEVITYALRGPTYLRKGDFDKATADYSKAIADYSKAIPPGRTVTGCIWPTRTRLCVCLQGRARQGGSRLRHDHPANRGAQAR